MKHGKRPARTEREPRAPARRASLRADVAELFDRPYYRDPGEGGPNIASALIGVAVGFGASALLPPTAGDRARFAAGFGTGLATMVAVSHCAPRPPRYARPASPLTRARLLVAWGVLAAAFTAVCWLVQPMVARATARPQSDAGAGWTTTR